MKDHPALGVPPWEPRLGVVVMVATTRSCRCQAPDTLTQEASSLGQPR